MTRKCHCHVLVVKRDPQDESLESPALALHILDERQQLRYCIVATSELNVKAKTRQLRLSGPGELRAIWLIAMLKISLVSGINPALYWFNRFSLVSTHRSTAHGDSATPFPMFLASVFLWHVLKPPSTAGLRR